MLLHPDTRGFDTGKDTHVTAWYHGSPADLAVGTVLVPGHAPNFKSSPKNAVSLTSEMDNARFWARKAANGQPFFVYEVEPLSVPVVHNIGPKNYGESTAYYEVRVSSARILSRAVHHIPADN